MGAERGRGGPTQPRPSTLRKLVALAPAFRRIWTGALATLMAVAVTACAGLTSPPETRAPQEPRRPSGGQPVDPRQAERLQRLMVPLIRVMDHPRPLSQVRVAIVDDPHINAASAGGGEFQVTTGLLQKANDRHLTGVLAHELAHDDLNHVAKAQALGAGLNIGMIILDKVIPGSGKLTPIAGALATSSYSRSEEYAADRHGVDLLQRAGLSKDIMIDTLTWLMQAEGPGQGGFFATHPATGDRIEALRTMH